LGGKSINHTFLKTKDYISIEATFVGVDFCSINDYGETCTLIYQYIVDGEQYFVSTDYKTGIISEIGITKTVKYNLNNPAESVVGEFNSAGALLFVGFMFVVVPLIMLVDSRLRFNSANAKKDVIKNKVFGVFIGLVFTILGGVTYYSICANGDSLSIIVAFQNAGFWLIIPLMFIVVGLLMTFGSVFSKGKSIKFNSYDVTTPDYVSLPQSIFLEKIIRFLPLFNYVMLLIVSMIFLIILVMLV